MDYKKPLVVDNVHGVKMNEEDQAKIISDLCKNIFNKEDAESICYLTPCKMTMPFTPREKKLNKWKATKFQEVTI